MPSKPYKSLYNNHVSVEILLQQLVVVTPLTNASCHAISLSALE